MLNEPPGLLPSPLLESKREDSARNKNGPRSRPALCCCPEGRGGRGASAAAALEGAWQAPAAPGPRAPGMGGSWAKGAVRQTCAPAAARPPRRVLAPGPAEPGGQGGRLSASASQVGVNGGDEPWSSAAHGSGTRRLLRASLRGRQDRATRCTATPLGSRGRPSTTTGEAHGPGSHSHSRSRPPSLARLCWARGLQ